MKCLLVVVLCLLALQPVRAADPYHSALPLYADNPRAPLRVHVTERRTFSDCTLARFTYAGKDASDTVPSLLYLPTRASRTHRVPCLIILHGLGGNKEEMAGLCRFLATAGYATLAIDLYGHGERAFANVQKAATVAQMTVKLSTTVTQTVVDVRRGLDYLGTVPQVDMNRLGLAGISLGAIIGTVASGVDPRLKATVLVSGGGGWGDILSSLASRATEYGGQRITDIASARWDLVGARLAPQDPLTFAPHIAPRALLMVNGDEDNVILPARAQALYAAARAAPNAHVRWERLPHAGHLPSVDTLFPDIRRWLAANL